MSSQGHYSPCTDDPLFGYSTGKMVEAKNLNHPTISTCTFSQSIQMASQTSPRLFKIQTWGCEVLWRHMTPCDSLHRLHSVIRFARWRLRVSEKHELSFHPPVFFPSSVCMHTSANLPESPAATTDGEDRTYPARASSNFASTLNSIWARVAAAWLGWQPDPPPYLRLSHHNTSSTAQHASSLWQI